MKSLVFSLFIGSMLVSCHTTNPENGIVKVTGAIKNVMKKGDVSNHIQLDTLHTEHLYGLGPYNELQGEILVNNGTVYVSKTTTDSTTMTVEKMPAAAAPFLVYTNVDTWQSSELPKQINSLSQLDFYLGVQYKKLQKPFPFKLIGTIDSATVHVQNLTPGSVVRSKKDAHKGQIKYDLPAQKATIIGFYSKEHQTIFTHHNAFTHMHLITEDLQFMGHLDAVDISEMTLFIPEYE